MNHTDLIWNMVGWTGTTVFFSRFLVQWFATEKKKQVVVPNAFWWLSIFGCLLLLTYAVFYDKHKVIIAGYAVSWIPYVRNLIINNRHKEAHLECANCGRSCPPEAKFCSECGTRLVGKNAALSA
jgi:lipid-A-disaccharide synthase-like uncharacterized protein